MSPLLPKSIVCLPSALKGCVQRTRRGESSHGEIVARAALIAVAGHDDPVERVDRDAPGGRPVVAEVDFYFATGPKGRVERSIEIVADGNHVAFGRTHCNQLAIRLSRYDIVPNIAAGKCTVEISRDFPTRPEGRIERTGRQTQHPSVFQPFGAQSSAEAAAPGQLRLTANLTTSLGTVRVGHCEVLLWSAVEYRKANERAASAQLRRLTARHATKHAYLASRCSTVLVTTIPEEFVE